MLTKILSIFLSFLMIYTSVLPAYAQAEQSASAQRAAVSVKGQEIDWSELERAWEKNRRIYESYEGLTPQQAEQVRQQKEAMNAVVGGEDTKQADHRILGLEKRVKDFLAMLRTEGPAVDEYSIFKQAYLEEVDKEYERLSAELKRAGAQLEKDYKKYSKASHVTGACVEDCAQDYLAKHVDADSDEAELTCRHETDLSACKEGYSSRLKESYEIGKLGIAQAKAGLAQWYREAKLERSIQEAYQDQKEAFRKALAQADEEAVGKAQQLMRQLGKEIWAEYQKPGVGDRYQWLKELVVEAYPVFWGLGGLNKAQREWARELLRKELAWSKDFCQRSSKACRQGAQMVGALAVLGEGAEDRKAIKEYMMAGADSEVAAEAILMSGLALLELGGAEELADVIKWESSRTFTGWRVVGAIVSPSDWVRTGNLVANGLPWYGESHANGCYLTQNAKGKEVVHSAWTDLGKYMAERAVKEGDRQSKAVLEKVMVNYLVTPSVYVPYHRVGGSDKEHKTVNVVVRLPIFVKGVLEGGYELVMPTNGNWQDVRNLLARNQWGSDLNGYVLGRLLQIGKSDLDPYTKAEVNHELYTAYTRVKSRPSLGYEVSAVPSHADVVKYNVYQDLLKIGYVGDAVMIIAGFAGLAKLAVKGAATAAKGLSQAARTLRVARKGMLITKSGASLKEFSAMYQRVVKIGRMRSQMPRVKVAVAEVKVGQGFKAEDILRATDEYLKEQRAMKAASDAQWAQQQAASIHAGAEKARIIEAGQKAVEPVKATGQISRSGMNAAGQTGAPLPKPSLFNAVWNSGTEALGEGWYTVKEIGSGLKNYFGPAPSTMNLSRTQQIWRGMKRAAATWFLAGTTTFSPINAEMAAAKTAVAANSAKVVQVVDLAQTGRVMGRTLSWADATKGVSAMDLVGARGVTAGLRSSGAEMAMVANQTTHAAVGLGTLNAGVKPFAWLKWFSPGSLSLGAFWDPERMKSSNFFSTPSSLKTTGTWNQYQKQLRAYDVQQMQLGYANYHKDSWQQYQDYLRIQQAYQMDNAPIRLDYERQGYPVTGWLQSKWQNVRDYWALKTAPFTLRHNGYYQAAQAPSATAVTRQAQTTASAVNTSNLPDIFSSAVFASELLALLAMGGAQINLNQSPKKRNALVSRLLRLKYTKTLNEVKALAKQRAIFEFLARQTELIDSFVEDQSFLAIYHEELKRAIASTKLPEDIKTLALQTIQEYMVAAAKELENNLSLAAKHTVMAIPLYHHNRVVNYWLVEPPAGFTLKPNQEVYGVLGEEKGKADLFESVYKEENRRDRSESTRLRADIPIEKVSGAFVTSGFGLRKVAEGLALMNNRLWPMYLIYVLAGWGNVSSTIATFAKSSFALSESELYVFGGVTSVVMGLSSILVGILQDRFSRNPDGSVNSNRGRLVSMNIGLLLCLASFGLPMFGDMGITMGEPTVLKKNLLISSFILLGMGAAFIDVAMKPSLLSATKKGDYQAKQGYLSVFKQVMGNMSNYIVPPLAMAMAIVLGGMCDWTIYFPIYTIATASIFLLYNVFKMHHQTLEDEEFSKRSTNVLEDFKKIGTELLGTQKYNQLMRHGVAATAAHGANMSMLGLFVNNLFQSHYPQMQNMYAAAANDTGFLSVFQTVWDVLSSSWLGHSLLAYTVPIIIGRMLGTAITKHDVKLFGKTIIKRQGLGTMLKVSVGTVGLALLAIASGEWWLQMVGVVLAALGLTNISPIVGGYTADHTRKISNTVSSLLSATSVISFGVTTLFGMLLEWSNSVAVSFLLPATLLAGIFYFGHEISNHRLEGEGEAEHAFINWLRGLGNRNNPPASGAASTQKETVAPEKEGSADDMDFGGGKAPAY